MVLEKTSVFLPRTRTGYYLWPGRGEQREIFSRLTRHAAEEVRSRSRVFYPTRNMTLPKTCCKNTPILHSRNISWLIYVAYGPLKILGTIPNHIHQHVAYSFKLWVWQFFNFPWLPWWQARVPTNVIFFGRPIPYLCKSKSFQIQASTLDNSPHVKIPLTQCYFLKYTP